jgi:hypothetical protein
MDSSREIEFEARLARIEESISVLQRSVDAILAGIAAAPTPAASGPNFRDQRRDPLAEQVVKGMTSGFAESSRRGTPEEVYCTGV